MELLESSPLSVNICNRGKALPISLHIIYWTMEANDFLF